MRNTRIIAAFVFATTLIFTLCLSSSAAALTDTLYCERGVAYFQPLNSSSGKWVDYTPSISNSIFTFSNLPNTLVENNYEYSFDFFAFLLYPNSNLVEFTDGYVYTYNFTIRSTRVATPALTNFEFGVTDASYNEAIPLADVVYTYDMTGSSTATYYVTCTVNVDNTFPASTLPSPTDAYLYLRIASEWSDTFQLRASNMTMKKAVGEGAYYQASIDAIENLPNTEYDFTLNKMPDADGTVEVIKGQADDITSELNLQLTNALGVFTGISGEEPLIYMPKMKIPILNLDIADYTAGYISQDGYFRPLDMIQDMDDSGQAILGINLARHFLQLVFVFTFATVGIEKMLRIEWWF